MRSKEEIQNAHDFLQALLVYDADQPKADKMNPELRTNIHLAHDAMGWALGLTCGNEFDKNLSELLRIVQEEGFVLTRLDSHCE